MSSDSTLDTPGATLNPTPDTESESIVPDESTEHKESSSSTSAFVQEITNRAVDFFSNASNEALGACFLGLGATTYLVLGRVGLVLIGLVGGIALHASWENSHVGNLGSGSKATEIRRRREVGLEVVKRVLDWREDEVHKEKVIEEGVSGIGLPSQRKEVDFSGFAPETRDALTSLADAVIRDYVKWWYNPILPDEVSFPTAARQTLASFILTFSSHLSRKRPADTFLDFLTNSSSIMIVFLGEISGALSASSSATPAEAVQDYLDANPESNLANLLDEGLQQKKLRMVADDVLQSFLDPKAYNCEPMRIFLREILAGVILEMTIQSCSKPEWINSWITYLLEDGEPDLINAIDAGVSANTTGLAGNPDSTERSQSEEFDPSETSEQNERKGHQRRFSKAEEAMEEAMLEAKRLSQLMAEEDARRRGEHKASTENETAEVVKRSSSISPDLSQPLSDQGAPQPKPASEFTSFDQLLPSQAPTALRSSSDSSTTSTQPIITPQFTMLHAKVSIFDDSTPAETNTLRAKPTAEYLIQIEPASSSHSGWMIVRKYADFESLHETLRRISVVSGASGFVDRHGNLPSWKGRTVSSLRSELEDYLRDSLSYRQLAESGRVKKFFEKDQGMGQSSPSASGKGGMSWSNPTGLENVGKGMLGALASAPKGAAAGGQALFGGVTGVFGSVGSLGQRKSTNDAKSLGGQKSASISSASLGRVNSISSSYRGSGDSQENLRSTPHLQTQSTTTRPSAERRPSDDPEPHLASCKDGKSSTDLSQTSSFIIETPQSSPLQGNVDEEIHLPPPPSEMPDNFDHLNNNSTSTIPHYRQPSQQQSFTASDLQSSTVTSSPPNINENKPTFKTPHSHASVTDAETRVAVSLFFALLTELYTLSSTSALRRTLLTAAKTYLLRPGPNNSSLDAIRLLLQDSVIDANSSDTGIAAHIRKIRENALPTEEETRSWEREKEHERMRDGGIEGETERKTSEKEKARKLLVERGVPPALRGVMGAAASGEAMGKVWDCLQIERVARGLVFGVLLQGVRAVTQ
ncbi:MAG: hypothetical protein M1837_000211 [Sclerophora amabilis]|nr:MAG: hypothetical protein M1837_000211 [Sclerophora amabilis]